MTSPLQLGIRIAVDGSAQAVSAVEAVGKSAAGVDQQMGRMGATVNNITSQFGRLATMVGSVLSVKEFIQQADAMSLLDGRLRNAVGSGQAFASAQAEIYRIAQANNVGLQETAQLYVKMNEPVRRMGGTAKEVGAIVDAFAMSLRVGGASSQEAASATLQFAQAMGSGRLQGDEFRAMAEASPRFMKALADGLNVPTEKLKQMGTDGKLTSDIVGNALIASLGKLKDEAAGLPDTVGGAFTRIKNDVLVAVNELNTKSGLTLGLAELLDNVRAAVPLVRDELAGAFEAVGGFIARNREDLGEAWTAVKGLAVDVYDIAKGVLGVAATVAEWVVHSGALKVSLEAVRLLVAGVVDGVTMLRAGLEEAGSLVLQAILRPLQEVLRASAAIAGMFDPDLAARITGLRDSIEGFATAGDDYARRVVQDFSEGRSAVGALGAELSKTARDSDEMKAALAAGGVSASDNARELARMGGQAQAAGDSFVKLKSAVSGQSKEAEAASKWVKKLVESLKEKEQASLDEIEATEQLTPLQQQQLKLYGEIDRGVHKLTLSQKLAIDAAFQDALAAEHLNDERKAQIKWLDETAKANERAEDAEWKRTNALRESIRTQQDANDKIGLSKVQIEQLEVAKLRDAQATAAAQLATLESIAAGDTPKARALREQIGLYDQLIDLKQKGVVKEAFAEEAAKARDEWKKLTDDVKSSLSDALTNAFETGSLEFDSLWDNIKKAFKSTVLRMSVQAVMSPVQQMLGGIFGGGAGGAAGAGGGSGWLNNLGSLFGGSGAESGVGAGLMALAGKGVSAFASMIGSSSMGAFGAGMGLTTSQAATAATAYANAGMSSTGSAVAAGSSFASNAIPIIGWIISGMLLNSADYKQGFNSDKIKYGNPISDNAKFTTDTLRMVGVDDRTANILSGAPALARLFGPKWSDGSWATGSFSANGFVQSDDMKLNFGNNTQKTHSDYLKTILDTVAGNVAGTAASLGGTWTKTAQMGAYTDTDRKGKVAAQIGYMNGSQWLAGVSTGVGSFLPGMQGAQKIELGDLEGWLGQQMPALILQGLQLSDLPEKFKTYFGTFGEKVISAEQAKRMIDTAQSVQLLTDAMHPLGSVFAKLGDLSVDATVKLTSMVGGIEEFGRKAQSFVASYYTTGEQNAIAAQGIAKTLQSAGVDITGLSSREQYRAMVDGLDLSKTADQAQLAALLNAAEGFAQLSDYLKESGKTLAQLAQSAPTVQLLDQLTAPADATTEAVNGVAEATLRTNDLLTTLDNTMRSGSDQTNGLLQQVHAALQASLAAQRAMADQLAAANARLAQIEGNGALNASAPTYRYDIAEGG